MVYEQKTAAIIVDMQPGFLQDYLELGKYDFWRGGKHEPNIKFLPLKARRMIRKQRDVLTTCFGKGIPIGILECVGLEEEEIYGRTIKNLREIWEQSPNGIYIKKHNDSGFDDTNLEQQLDERGIENLILMGINAHACVMATARDGISLGYRVFSSPCLIDNVGNSKSRYHEWYERNCVYRRQPRKILEAVAA